MCLLPPLSLPLALVFLKCTFLHCETSVETSSKRLGALESTKLKDQVYYNLGFIFVLLTTISNSPVNQQTWNSVELIFGVKSSAACGAP